MPIQIAVQFVRRCARLVETTIFNGATDQAFEAVDKVWILEDVHVNKLF